MVHDDTTLYFRCLNEGVTYYSTTQAIGEAGIFAGRTLQSNSDFAK